MTKSLTYVELDIDYCSLTYGVPPCQASLTSSPPTGTHKCFNTRASCQDPANYTEVGATLRFAINTNYLPPEIDCIPSVKNISFTPATVSLGEDLGQRASLTVEFKDHKHSDIGPGFDKYYATRGYDTYEQGTFWGRFHPRHPYLQSYSIRVIRGLLGDELANMETRNYIIENIEGPSYDGFFKIIAKDVLKLADGDRAQAPALSDGTLSADITIGALQMTLAPTGIGESDYPATGYINLGGEIVSFTRPFNADLLIHADGNSPLAIVDATGNHALTIVGNATASTAQSVFGGASIAFDGTGDAVRANGAADLVYGTGDYVLRFRMRVAALGANGANVFDFRQTASTDVALQLFYSNVGALNLAIGITNKLSTTIVINTWYEITVSRVAGVGYMFKDGVLVGSYAHTDNLVCGAARPTFGERWDSNAAVYMNGWMDEILSKKGSGISAAYTPPASAFVYARGDIADIVRARLNTVAVAHTLGDRAQLVLAYVAQDPAVIISDLLQTYANVPAAYVPLSSWVVETEAFLNTVYTGYIAEPKSVNDLISELIDIASLSMWWDDRSQLIKLQVLRQIPVTAATYTDDDRIEFTLEIKEQPEKRLSQIWTYFGKLDPTKNEDELDNYTSIAKTIDAQAEIDYGVPAIQKRFTRWIPVGGAATAQSSNAVKLERFRVPPRRFTFDLHRRYSAEQDPTLGGGYQLEGWPLQDETGARATVPIQITRLNAEADRYEVEAEEMQAEPLVSDPAIRVIVIDANMLNANLRTLHDSLYTAPQSGDTVILIIQEGVIIGSANTTLPALNIGSWPAGVTRIIQGPGRIEGAGGMGGGFTGTSSAGSNGGTALYTRATVTINMASGAKIWSGGGGGGVWLIGSSYYAGGGGGGYVGGAGGIIPESNAGSPGTVDDGGAGGFGIGGVGGDPGSNGVAGNATAGGTAGAAIDGVSFCTISSPTPSILGGQIN